jgi:uncharacterized protein (TIGR02145 family)
MNSKLTKFAKVAALGLALTFTLSCSSGSDDNGGGTSSPSGNGDLSSSSAGDSGGGGSSSSATSGGGSSSSVGGGDASSSSIASGGGSSSSVTGGGDGSCPATTNGTFTDSRDSKSYKWVSICEQTWMAENLNYDVPDNDTDVCYGNDPANCVTYGKLYDWATAMGIEAKYNDEEWGGSDENHQGLCPAGWHIPSDAEWSALMEYVSPGCSQGYCANAGTKLKAADGWNPSSGIPVGTDDYDFKAMPGGKGEVRIFPANSDYNVYRSVGEIGYWWSATEQTDTRVFYRRMYYNYDYTRWDVTGKSSSTTTNGVLTAKDINLHSVRCIKD